MAKGIVNCLEASAIYKPKILELLLEKIAIN
jgi:hypothetical protein